MKKVKEQFNNLKNKHPELGDYILLCMIVEKKNYTILLLTRLFKKLVTDEDWSSKEKKDLINYLYLRSIKVKSKK